MTLELSEKEMISRFSDSMKRAASSAKTMTEDRVDLKPQALLTFVHELKVAAGSAHQLFIYRENLFMEKIRDTLEAVIEQAQNVVATAPSIYWFTIKQALENIAVSGLKSVDQKAMTRQDVLANLDYKQKNLNTDG
jgi:hypothetical protein